MLITRLTGLIPAVWLLSLLPFLLLTASLCEDGCEEEEEAAADEESKFSPNFLLSGDVEINPGPYNWKYPCRSCSSNPVKANQAGILCDICSKWYHIRCISMSMVEYAHVQNCVNTWGCSFCSLLAMPFHNSSLHTTINSSNDNLTSSAVSDSTSIASSCQPHKLIILSLNCRSLPPKIDNLRLLPEAQHPHVIALCETWLDNSIKDQEMTIEGYFLVRRDRNRHGGGIAAYLREDVPFTIHSSHSSLELLLLNLKLASGTLVCGIFYRSHHQKPLSYLSRKRL